MGFLKTFGQEFLKASSKVAEHLPGAKLAESIGVALATPEASKWQEETLKREMQLQDLIRKRVRETARKGDKEKLKQYQSIAKKTGNIDIISETVKDAPTSKQIIASAGELALTAAIGLKPGVGQSGKFVTAARIKQISQTKKAAEALKLQNAGVARKVLIKVAKPAAKEAVFGSAFFGFSKTAQDRNASVNDVVRDMEKGALLGGGTMVGGALVGQAFKTASKYIKPKIAQKWEQGMTALEKIAAAEPPKIKGHQSQLNKTLSFMGPQSQTGKIKHKVAEKVLEGVTKTRKMQSYLIDRFSPLARIEKKIEKISDTPLSEAEKVYRDARLISSVSDFKAEKKATDLIKKLQPYQNIQKEYKAWLMQLDFIDRAKLGQQVPGGQTLDELMVGLRQLAEEMGPEKLQRVKQVRHIIKNHNVQLLQERVEAGLISREAMEALQTTHPNYIPHNVIMDMEEQAVRGISQSLNVPKTDIMKAVGSTKNITDPLKATIQRTPIATHTIEKNKLLNNLIKAQEKYNIMPGARRLASSEKAKTGFGTVDLFINGEKQTWQVPEDIAVAIKNLDAPVTPGWWKILTTPQALLKKSATQFNLSFTIPNLFRDKQTAAITANAFIEELAKKMKVSPKTLNLSRKEILALYKESGGYGASIFREGDDAVFRKFEKIGVAKKMEYANPLKIIDKINDELEQSTRLDVFKKALQRGLSPKDAAYVSRNATVDFARMGTWMRPLNRAIPFLNARVQGFLNIPKAIAASPETFARMQLWTSVYPTMLLHQHNRRFEGYANIPQYYKNKYWIIMTGQTESLDPYTGKKIMVPQFVTLPKGEGQALISGPIQYFLEKSDGRDFRSTSEMLADTLGSASPLEFQSFDQSNWWGTAFSQLGPGATIASGLFSNKHPYFGSEIVPEHRLGASPEMQFKRTTPAMMRDLGKVMNVSPAKIDFAIDSFGGLSQDVKDTLDLLYIKALDKPKIEQPLTDTWQGRATKTPLARRFIRETSDWRGPETVHRREQKKEIEQASLDKSLSVTDQAEFIWREMNKREAGEERLNYLNSLGNELTPEITEKLKRWKRTRQSVEVLKTTDSVEVRAQYILMRIDEMKADGTSKQERVEFLNDLEESKILTKNVKKRIAELKKEENTSASSEWTTEELKAKELIEGLNYQ